MTQGRRAWASAYNGAMPANRPLLEPTPGGLWCPAGGFFIDPPRRAARAILTHAHSDHARKGHGEALVAEPGRHVFAARIGAEGLRTVSYGEPFRLGETTVSLHPAGHVLGSAQVRIERRGEVWVVTGDYKRHADPTAASFVPLTCDVLVTETTFGLPIYRWPAPAEVFAEIAAWWAANAGRGVVSVLLGYSLGKAQRLLASLPARHGPIVCHPAIAELNAAYRASGVALPREIDPAAWSSHPERRQGLVMCPPHAAGEWLAPFFPIATAFASGWAIARKERRRGAAERGFVLSDHADWDGLNATVRDTGARRVLTTPGCAEPFARWLREQGIAAAPLGGTPRREETRDLFASGGPTA